MTRTGLRLKIRDKYGDTFFDEAFEEVHAAFLQGESITPGTKRFTDVLTFWFHTLDTASEDIGQTVEGVEIPMAYFAALVFLSLTPDSPFIRQTHFPADLDFLVASMLEQAKAQALGHIELIGEVGGRLRQA